MAEAVDTEPLLPDGYSDGVHDGHDDVGTSAGAAWPPHPSTERTKGRGGFIKALRSGSNPKKQKQKST